MEKRGAATDVPEVTGGRSDLTIPRGEAGKQLRTNSWDVVFEFTGSQKERSGCGNKCQSFLHVHFHFSRGLQYGRILHACRGKKVLH